ncbi:hypothetical protein TNCV_1257101 [Trichonephila clavipes]|nr:hypothetical protein TNCV_1257101 [Trichonephila clavipes]
MLTIACVVREYAAAPVHSFDGGYSKYRCAQGVLTDTDDSQEYKGVKTPQKGMRDTPPATLNIKFPLYPAQDEPHCDCSELPSDFLF